MKRKCLNPACKKTTAIKGYWEKLLWVCSEACKETWSNDWAEMGDTYHYPIGIQHQPVKK